MLSVLTTDATLHALAPEWEVLWRRCGSPPFQSPHWLLSWWESFGTGQPRIATWRSGGVLTGLLPMYLLDEPPERKLLPLGIGITDYCDALLDPALPPDVPGALLGALLARDEGVTSCTLPDLPPGAALRGAATPLGWRDAALPGTPCPVLDLSGGWAAIPPGTQRNVRQARHRAGRRGGWSAYVADDPVAAWHDLVRLHDTRWSGQGQPGGVLADLAVLAFHASAVPRLAASGVLRMQVLTVAGRPAAVYQTLASPGRLAFYLSGFDAAQAYVSPGTLLLGHVVDAALAEGVRELHFLRGGEAYKYQWGATDRTNAGRVLSRIGQDSAPTLASSVPQASSPNLPFHSA